MTAAHCVFSKNLTLNDKSIFTVAQGPELELDDDVDKLRPMNAQGTSSVEKIIPHPKYDPGDESIPSDIAILVLSKALPGPTVTLAKAGASAKLPDGAKMTTIGFGYNNFYPRQPNGEKEFIPYFAPTLYQLTLSLGKIGRPPCNFEGLDNKRQLCLVGKNTSFDFLNEDAQLERVNGTQSSCRGDSGGPLFYKGVQYGLVSFGRGLCTEFLANPSVFTKISSHRKYFIDPIVKEYT